MFGLHYLSAVFSPILFPFYYQRERYYDRYLASRQMKKKKPNPVEVNSSTESFSLLSPSILAPSESTSTSSPSGPQYPPEQVTLQNLDWDVHVVAFIHAIISGFGSLYCYLMTALKHPDFLSLALEPFFATTAFTCRLLEFSIGYFAYDFIISSMNFSLYGKSFWIHAFLSLFGAIVLYLSQAGHYYGMVFLMFELSTPFMNLRWFLANLNMKSSLFYTANGLLFMASFFLIRIVFGLYQVFTLTRIFWTTTDQRIIQIRMVCVIATFTLSFLNLMWFSLIWKGFWAHLTRKVKSK